MTFDVSNGILVASWFGGTEEKNNGVGISQDGKNWRRVVDLEPLTATTDKKGEEYSYPTVIQSPEGMIHIVYTWNRKTVKHLVLDPEKLLTKSLYTTIKNEKTSNKWRYS